MDGITASDDCGLPMGNAPLPLEFGHFPTRWQAVIWRNWMYVPAERIAALPERTCFLKLSAKKRGWR